jgi:hypothetical protein
MTDALIPLIRIKDRCFPLPERSLDTPTSDGLDNAKLGCAQFELITAIC